MMNEESREIRLRISKSLTNARSFYLMAEKLEVAAESGAFDPSEIEKWAHAIRQCVCPNCFGHRFTGALKRPCLDCAGTGWLYGISPVVEESDEPEVERSCVTCEHMGHEGGDVVSICDGCDPTVGNRWEPREPHNATSPVVEYGCETCEYGSLHPGASYCKECGPARLNWRPREREPHNAPSDPPNPSESNSGAEQGVSESAGCLVEEQFCHDCKHYGTNAKHYEANAHCMGCKMTQSRFERREPKPEKAEVPPGPERWRNRLGSEFRVVNISAVSAVKPFRAVGMNIGAGGTWICSELVCAADDYLDARRQLQRYAEQMVWERMED